VDSDSGAWEEEPLNEEERDLVRRDLVDVESLKELLGPKGVRGVVFFCTDCEEDHFLQWDLLSGNLKELLEAGESPVHEPAFNPNPDEYVTWDYARGFLDGYEMVGDEDLQVLADQLATELRNRGWDRAKIDGLLSTLGIGRDDQGG
jgi:Family of unknown function (DUF5319)